tara:strand:- start:455 stop:1336 length:882 start_codon:yes stop_codon:yes gene_type:complete
MLERGGLTEGEQDFFNAVSFASNPVGFAAKTVGSEIFGALEEAGKNQGDSSMLDYGGQGFNRGMSSNVAQAGTSGGGFFGNLGQTLGDVGRGIGNFFGDIDPLLSVFGANNPIQRTNSGTATTIIRQAPDEQASSGEILGANLGLAGPLMQAGRQLFRSPGGQTALGFGAGAVGAALMPAQGSAPRVTRKMKSDVRRIYMMSGMDPATTAQILNNMGTYPRMNFNAALVFFILTKRFRNDGPVVTKAAVRKTKTTLRRMKGVVDMYNSVCKPTAPRRRAAPSRAKAVQLISNK